MGASEIVKATTAGEVRSIDVITSVVDRMQKVNPKSVSYTHLTLPTKVTV